jgi:HlyD family secretion protein
MALITKKNRWYWIGGLALVALTIGAAIKGRNSGNGTEVELSKVERRNIVERVQASGKVFPVQEVSISSDVSGEIVELLVKEGDSVKAGQLLARINPDIYESASARTEAAVNASRAQAGQARASTQASRNQVNTLKSQRDQVEANLNLARQNNERNEKLFKDGVIAELEVQSSRASLRAQEAALQAAEATIIGAQSNIEQAEQSARAADFNVKGSEAGLTEAAANLRRTRIFAPMHGVVSHLGVEKGERVVGSIQMSGTEIMRIANMSSMEVQVNVNENEVLRLHLGDSADVSLDAYPRRVFKGKITEIARTASNALGGQAALVSDQVTNFVVKILLDPAAYADLTNGGRNYPFLPGMSATADIYTHTATQVLTVPLASVTRREKEAFVQKKKDAQKDEDETTTVERTMDDIRIVVFVSMGDTVRMVEVGTGLQDDDFIEITSGLKGDEEVVHKPYNAVARDLNGGDRITKKKADDKKSGVSISIN